MNNLKKLFPSGIPLAWRQLTLEKKRFTVALIGVSFAIILMVFQLGIYEAIIYMVIQPISAMKGDLVMISRNSEYYTNTRPFPAKRLYQVNAFKEVKDIYPVMTDTVLWRNPDTGVQGNVALYGIQQGRNPFFQPEITENEYILGLPDGLFYDTKSNKKFGRVEELFSKNGIFKVEINDKRARIMKMITIGRTLSANLTLVSGVETFSRLTGRPAGQISFGMIELREGADPEKVALQLTATLPEDIEVITRTVLMRREQAFWKKVTPIGFIITAGMSMAMLVGAIIVYQILYTDINDHIKEYATLKALGLNNAFFLKLILQESVILLGIAFIPSLIFCQFLFYIAISQAGIPTNLSFTNITVSFGLAAIMCMGAGYFATRRLRSADPAEIF